MTDLAPGAVELPPRRRQTKSSSFAEFNEAAATKFRTTQLVPSGDCLLWPVCTARFGYGVLTAPLGYYRQGRWLTHRVAYFMATGTDPAEWVVRHKCDNPPCCNPDHLELGTKADNTQDAVTRGRLSTTNLDGYQARREAIVLDRIARGVGWCPQCKQELPSDRFYPSTSTRSGLASTCSQCANARRRETWKASK